MDKRNPDATRSALIMAAERLMAECNDPSEVTSRAITKAAGVNLAMINYCFGSRDALLYEVYRDLKERAADSDKGFGEIVAGDLSPKDKLIELHFMSMRLMIDNFKYAKAVIKYTLLNREIGDDRESLPLISAHFAGKLPEDRCRLIAYELSSIHQLLVLRYEELRDCCGIDLTDDDILRRTVTDNVNRLLDTEV